MRVKLVQRTKLPITRQTDVGGAQVSTTGCCFDAGTKIAINVSSRLGGIGTLRRHGLTGIDFRIDDERACNRKKTNALRFCTEAADGENPAKMVNSSYENGAADQG